MADETLMPPRCCRVTIPLRSVERLLGHDTVVEFEEKLREFSTKNRLYCPQETCSAFIGEASSTKGEQVNCPKCGITVCTYCKTTSHSVWEACSDDKDPASKLVLELGEREGWRRCGGCRRLVELDHGWCAFFQLDYLWGRVTDSGGFCLQLPYDGKNGTRDNNKATFLTVSSSVYVGTSSVTFAVRRVSIFL